MKRHPSLLRTVAALVVTGQLIGCTGWYVESLSPDWSARAEHRALALTDVKEVATRHLSPGRTAGLVLGIGAVVGVIVGLSNMQGLENWGQ
jgi:hypothetical protein